MKKTAKAMIYKFAGTVASFAFLVTMLNINTTCMFTSHQPEMPKNAKSLRKF